MQQRTILLKVHCACMEYNGSILDPLNCDHTPISLENQHWNENVIILMKVSSLAAPKVVILTTFGAASDEDFIKMKTFSFQWTHNWPGMYPCDVTTDTPPCDVILCDQTPILAIIVCYYSENRELSLVTPEAVDMTPAGANKDKLSSWRLLVFSKPIAACSYWCFPCVCILTTPLPLWPLSMFPVCCLM